MQGPEPAKIDGAIVREDFNDLPAVLLYTRAAHYLGLWRSERLLVQRFFTDLDAPILEAGCGAGRATIGLYELGYRDITAFDFADGLLEQAASLARERGVGEEVRFFSGDATRLAECDWVSGLSRARPGWTGFGGVLFLFNGLMQIPGRESRRAALNGLRALCRPGAPLLFTTHDRDCSAAERARWRIERARWDRGEQDPRLLEFGDRYFEHEHGRTFMHLPVRAEILEDLAATGWRHGYDALRSGIVEEPAAVREFSDECRFWMASA